MSVVGFVVCTILASQYASAGGKIYQYDVGGTVIPIGGENWIPFTSPTDLASNTNDLPVPLQSTTRYVDIIPDSASDSIPRLTFTGGPSDWVKIYLGVDQNVNEPGFVATDDEPARAGLHLRGIDASGLYESQFYGGITGNFGVECDPQPCNGTDYIFKVDRLVRFDVGGVLYGDITVGGESSWTPLVVEAGTMSAESSLVVSNGSITRLKTFGVTSSPDGPGDLKIAVTVSNGDIALIQSSGRITGYGGGPIQAPTGKIESIVAAKPITQHQGAFQTTPMIQAQDGIDSIEAPSIDAYITANVAGDGEIRKIVTSHSTNGVGIHSRIVAKKVVKSATDDRIEIKGDLLGELVMDELAANATIAIGGRIYNDGSTNKGKIQINGAAGLKGQILLNAFNNSGQDSGSDGSGLWSYYWDGPISVNGTTINNTSAGANQYWATASTVYGGGSVGVVKFNFHRADCIG